MILSAFVAVQILFDITVVALVAVYVFTRKAAPAPEPPEWYGQFVALAQEVMAATEPMLERLEQKDAPPPAPAPIVIPDCYNDARALLESGASPDEVAARAGLRPGELRLLAKIVTAEARSPIR
jgi:hypothetical protein